ncbi:GIY-YIG nuclease family protein [Bradyrhizobium sp. Ai1a-2]|uniref:GIY-YIG nuclease family protein n=1 Tax=Bradyrhizobium sp. Ai1a-2 TaxID=196490 RepID=UPI0004818CB8|nr:GIY-YIG nuclease family protein [Bradyrhizobium sp. Ai1a-2]
MTTSDQIRLLAAEGLSTTEIARRLGIRYQHAYNVVRGASGTAGNNEGRQTKSLLPVAELLAGGFVLSARWMLSEGSELILDCPLPKEAGVYAFAKADTVLYVGIATIGLAKRLYFYGRPGPKQITNLRLNEMLKSELRSVPHVHIYTAIPPNFEWNGLPVHGSAGLEFGLIRKYSLPWNVRSAA